MAKNDYFVIAYKVLKYLYECLKKGVRPNMDILDAGFFQIAESYWAYIIGNLNADGYITGIMRIEHDGDEPIIRVTSDIKITPKGIEYLEENSTFKKIKEAAKDIRGMLPF